MEGGLTAGRISSQKEKTSMLASYGCGNDEYPDADSDDSIQHEVDNCTVQYCASRKFGELGQMS